MLYRRLGATGLQVSALAFGAWMTFGRQIGRGTARDLVAMAWDHGINLFDNAEGYADGEAERVMGDVIADLRLPRDGFAVTSKVMFGSASDPLPMQKGLSRKHCLLYTSPCASTKMPAVPVGASLRWSRRSMPSTVDSARASWPPTSSPLSLIHI